ncbi:MAG: DegT/DnrJ/EryC1/StrS family aminotransferase [Symbiobacterium sp.]|uniref:DegT/DnrJ/EryC1/StrS family aminotransferase n=1 Tax=Symbiobacterium sp. TaxID=1971213 RepID=UPI0034646126
MRERVPMLDLAAEVEFLWEPQQGAIQEVLRSGQFILGPEVEALERELAAYLGVRHAITLNSGTDALVIALRALGVGPGDEVITTPFTFFATVEAICHAGATPVFADIDPDTFTLDPDLAAAAVTPRTRAIVPVHLFGHAAEMARLRDLAGAHGSRRKCYHERVGYNSRLDVLQAAILRVKLPHVDEWNRRRQAAAAYYQEILADLPGVVLPAVRPEVEHVFHQYTIRILNGRRDEVQRALSERGISTMVYYPVPLHRLPVFRHLNLSLPAAEAAAREVLSLPIGPFLRRDQQDEVAAALRAALR